MWLCNEYFDSNENRLKMQHQSILNAKFTRQTGLSMVELLIAMAMGLAITTVVLNIFLNMMTGNRVSTAQQQMKWL